MNGPKLDPCGSSVELVSRVTIITIKSISLTVAELYLCYDIIPFHLL